MEPISALSGDFELSRAAIEDIDDIIHIERISQPSPWARSIFENELTLDYSNLWVARTPENRIAAYISFWIVADEIHILNVVVHPHFRRLGLAQGLIQSLLLTTSTIPLISISLEVRESNLPAQRLYAKFGFIEIGRRPNYYSDNNETAIVMTRVMSEPEL